MARMRTCPAHSHAAHLARTLRFHRPDLRVTTEASGVDASRRLPRASNAQGLMDFRHQRLGHAQSAIDGGERCRRISGG